MDDVLAEAWDAGVTDLVARAWYAAPSARSSSGPRPERGWAAGATTAQTGGAGPRPVRELAGHPSVVAIGEVGIATRTSTAAST